jgi:diguanylate cyclase (GGDEF)-like protein
MKTCASNKTRNLFPYFLPASIFFEINDIHGHGSVNDIFINISNILNTEKREAGQVGRWGSKVPAFTSLENYRGAVQYGNKICELISAKPIIYEGQETHRTMSFWGSTDSEDTNIKKTIDQTDQRFYSAKNFGRKKVVWEDTQTKLILM